jgi:hypothetical protein
VEAILQDLKYAARTLGRAPAFTACLMNVEVLAYDMLHQRFIAVASSVLLLWSSCAKLSLPRFGGQVDYAAAGSIRAVTCSLEN